MMRGMEVVDTGNPVSVPVGTATLGRVFNVLGNAIDERGPVEADAHMPFTEKLPQLMSSQRTLKVFETGIKVVDLLTPFVRGGKAGLFGVLDSERRLS